MLDIATSRKYVMYNHILSFMALVDTSKEEIREVMSSLWRTVNDSEEARFLNAVERFAMREYVEKEKLVKDEGSPTS
jgi:hypothetical protein